MEEWTMKRIFAVSLLLACAAATWAAVPAAAQGKPAAQTAKPAVQTADTVRQAVRTDKRGLVEKNMKLTPEEAKAFWPLYDDYQRDLDAIQTRQNRSILDYINSESSMTDANAKRIVNDVLAADGEEQLLRERLMRKLFSALPGRKAARFFQIDNKIRALNRFDVAERLPLVH
jgi:predicted transglutaminase-like cysteine proteinase